MAQNFIFTSRTCSPCHTMMARVNALGPLPTDLSVLDASSFDAMSIMSPQGIRSTPAAIIGGKWYLGVSEILAALGQHYGVRL